MAAISSLNTPLLHKLEAAISPTGTAGTKNGLENIGKDEFFKLLVAQLKNQDPLSPLKNEEFVAQLATFSSLEQLISINKAVQQLANGSTPDVSGTQKTVL